MIPKIHRRSPWREAPKALSRVSAHRQRQRTVGSKKIRGKVYYFGLGPIPRPLSGNTWRCNTTCTLDRTPRPKDGYTLEDLCNDFHGCQKTRQLDVGEIIRRSFYDYHRVCERVLAAIDRNRLVEDLAPDDFGPLREKLTETPRARLAW